MRLAQLAAASALKTMIENTEGDNPDIKSHRRAGIIQLGAVPALLHLITYAPRMPPPAHMPAPLAAAAAGGKKKAGGVAGVAKGKKDRSSCNTPQGGKDLTATLAAACLRFLALSPGFVQELLGECVCVCRSYWVRVCVCVYLCVCVCVQELLGECVCVQELLGECVCVQELLGECVCVRVCVCVCVCAGCYPAGSGGSSSRSRART